MQHKVILIAKKEIARFFASPAAFIFFGAFLAVTLFIFFWVETFFARNISDARPLFDWMPVLLIFLVAALTMRSWSEEKRSGTLEFLLTEPVSPLYYVLGKFLACMALVGIALLLTLPLPFTISLLGNLDWWPVFGAYLATLFLAGAYTAIGLTVSARSDNQIVSLITTVLVCSLFYLLGSDTLTQLFGNRAGELFKLLGSGSRFTSITRGVIDVRDLYYYLSIIGIFLSLNLYFLESGRWATESPHTAHGRWRLLILLLIANFAAANVWLQKVGWARADLTEGRIYSISDATRLYLEQLQEPLLIRGYFSAKTHPLLAPLVPQLRDLILEYQVASRGKVRAEFIDPLEHPDLEEEAGQKYGIKPVPFQVADKYQASLVNSYFDVVIQYGDQYQVLGFRDLIEVKAMSESQMDVELRNPEYEITRSIKKVLYEYQGSGDLFAELKNKIQFIGYFSPDKRLPQMLIEFRTQAASVLDELKTKSSGKFNYEFLDPDAGGAELTKEISEQYGFRPMRAGLFDPNTFYFYMVLKSGDQSIQVPLTEDLNKESFRRSLEAALKRYSSGFLKTVALLTPAPPEANPYMPQMQPPGKEFQLLQEKLGENHKVTTVNLDKGLVPEDIDLLLLAAPKALNEKQLFAVDQFLMKGGTVILSTSPFESNLENGSLNAGKYDSGLGAWLEHFGIRIGDSMILDPQNAKLPIPITRNVGGFRVQEIRMVEYPYFVDVRGEGLNEGEGLSSGIEQVTIDWASPVEADAQKNKERRVVEFLKSTQEAWTSDSTQVLPDFRLNGPLGFVPAEERKSYTMGLSVEGRFDSFFKGKASPLLSADKQAASPDKPADQEEDKKEPAPVIAGTIEKSPESARIIVFASNEFLSDQTIRLASSAGGTLYTNSLDLAGNAVDWSLEDRGLLSIRGRGHFSRTLHPAAGQSQSFWEYLNYGFAMIGLLLVYFAYRYSCTRAELHYHEVLENGGL
ncbi:MAG: Gldg family protein [Methylococcaceae bacterium]|nr:Gldg family protein [Methylococcaceae bacterium]